MNATQRKSAPPETYLYQCPYCGEVWRGDAEPHADTHAHATEPEGAAQPVDVEFALEQLEDDGRTLDATHDFRSGVWIA